MVLNDEAQQVLLKSSYDLLEHERLNSIRLNKIKYCVSLGLGRDMLVDDDSGIQVKMTPPYVTADMRFD